MGNGARQPMQTLERNRKFYFRGEMVGSTVSILGERPTEAVNCCGNLTAIRRTPSGS